MIAVYKMLQLWNATNLGKYNFPSVNKQYLFKILRGHDSTIEIMHLI